MSRSNKIAAASAAAPAEIATPTLADTPVISALVALLGAVAALASFPSSPVPESMVQAVAKAREAFLAALDQPLDLAFAPEGEGSAGGYDDAWIKEQLADLDKSLVARFKSLDEALEGVRQSIESLATAESEGRASLAARVQAIETASAKAAPKPAADQA